MQSYEISIEFLHFTHHLLPLPRRGEDKAAPWMEMKDISCIIFDFDGTIADTASGIVKTVNATFMKMGIPVPDEDKVRSTIGLPLGDSLRIAAGLPDDRVQEAVDTYRSLFCEVEARETKLFPGVSDTLKELYSNGIRMAIATSRGMDSLEVLLGQWGIGGLFETCVTATDGLRRKPAPDMVLSLLKRMSVPADGTLVAGDTTFDIEMGNGAGCRTCAVTYGNHSPELLKSVSPHYMVEDFPSIKDIVLR